MKEINFNDIEKLWEMNKFPTMLYIHSPYCKSICNYCCYKGRLKDKTFTDYFQNYLPSQIKKYKEIIKKQSIDVIYFGGGTANYLPDLSNLDKTFELIRDIPFKEKVIELHCGLPITDKTIDKIISEGFNSVILCIQTFDYTLLKSVNRINIADNNIAYIIQRFHDAGILVASDFLYFPKYGIQILKNDIQVINQFDFDEVSIATIYQEKCIVNQQELYDALKEMRLQPELGSLEQLMDLYQSVKVQRFFSQRALDNPDRFFLFEKYLDEESKGAETSCIGIGSYLNQCKDTFSHINKQYTYCERWDGKETKYTLLRCESFYDKMRDFIDWLEEHAETDPPDNLHIEFINNDGAAECSQNTRERMCMFNFWTEYPCNWVEEVAKHPDIQENDSQSILGYSLKK